ncbi:ATP-binding protein [Amycolatopsis nigrescens]|uniref:ATP-binding protein n=1 Tax=Amycolatopsis nigrescens TaxID=381445 RepID=UPI00037D9E57|nr:tetratricopeptide repeat protein [Amycolatopsis nigrescens]
MSGAVGTAEVGPLIPRQLAAPPAHFTNRSAELAELDRILDVQRDRPFVQVITGPGGIGKTALATHWTNRVRARFPRGQLHADLGAFAAQGPVDPGEVLGQFLRSLGVAPSLVPIGLAEQIALYRTLTTDNPLLVLLDNAASTEQVRALLPGGSASVVVVTARSRLGGLLAQDGAALLTLEPLTPVHGRELLTRTLGAHRIGGDGAEATDIVRLCGGLPIALAVMGARLATRPRASLAKAAADLARRRLPMLSVKGDLSVQATFDLSYEALPAEAARLYRLLGVHPGAEFSTGIAAAAADLPADDVEPLLEELVDVGLLHEPEEDRYRFHDLIRLHAKDASDRLDSPRDRESALRRMLESYLHTASATGELTVPDQSPIPYDFEYQPHDRPSFDEPEQAMAWLELERTNLIAAIVTAAEHDLPELGWQLAAAMWPLFLLRKHYRDFLTVSQLGVDCARRWGNGSAEALMRNRSGSACRGAGRFDEAIEHYRGGLMAATGAGDEAAAIRSVEGLGLVALAQDRLPDALELFEDDLERSTGLNRAHDVSLALINLGATLTRMGRDTEAIERLSRARELLAEQGDEYNEARARTDLARVLARAGRHAEAAAELDSALATMRQRGSRFEEARALEVLGEVAEAAGDLDAARRHYETALPILRDLGRPEATRLGERLETLDESSAE